MGFFSSYSGNDKQAVNVEFVLKMLDRLIPPIGFIYMSASSDNPSTIYPDTIWTEWGKGRVPVGVDASQTEFNTGEKTGGEKTSNGSGIASLPDNTGSHTLTLSQIPSHRHGVYALDRSIRQGAGEWQNTWDNTDSVNGFYSDYAGGGSGHTHPLGGSVTVNFTANTLQPYITCYMFKRTA